MEAENVEAGAGGPGGLRKTIVLILHAEMKIAASVLLAIVLGVVILLLAPMGRLEWSIEARLADCDSATESEVSQWVASERNKQLVVGANFHQITNNRYDLQITYANLTVRDYIVLWGFPAAEQPLPSLIRVNCRPESISFSAPHESSPGMLRLTWMSSWYIAILALVFGFTLHGRKKKSRTELPQGISLLYWPSSGILAFLVVSILLKILDAGGLQLRTPQMDLLTENIEQNGWILVMAVLVGPICEELLFRRWLLQTFIRERQIKLGVVVSTLSFAAIHTLGEPIGAAALVYYGLICLLSIGLCLAYIRAGSIWAPAAAHVTYNAASIAFAFGSSNL